MKNTSVRFRLESKRPFKTPLKRMACVESELTCEGQTQIKSFAYDHDVIKWKHFPYYWLFVRGIDRSPVDSLHKGQWHGALMFPLICAWTNDWTKTQDASCFRRHHSHYDVIVMKFMVWYIFWTCHVVLYMCNNHAKIDNVVKRYDCITN